MIGEKKRKFHNPTPGWVGVVVLDDDNKTKGLPVEPGGSVWLSPAEERLTAEAPRLAEDNPFTKEWREPTEFGANGEPTAWKHHKGVLQLSDEPAREIVSDRFIPPREDETVAADVTHEQEAGETEPAEQEITGAPPIPTQPPVVGKPAPDEHVATPEAVRANDEFLARRAEEEKAEASDGEKKDDEQPTPIGDDGPRGQDSIGLQREGALV